MAKIHPIRKFFREKEPIRQPRRSAIASLGRDDDLYHHFTEGYRVVHLLHGNFHLRIPSFDG